MEALKCWGRKLGIESLCLILLLLLLTGCSERTADEKTEESHKLNVVTTIFPYYDFTRQIAGDEITLSMVVPAGMDSHSFEPTPADMRLIQEADILICNGGEMEQWLAQVLDALDPTDMTIVTMMDYVDTFDEVLVEGMETQEGHDGHELAIEYDEHIWTSPLNAMEAVQVIGKTLREADTDNKSLYQARELSYLEKLKQLDEEMNDIVTNEKRNMIVVADKFPFRYLAETYGWDYRAAFSGCSTDTEPSAKTIAYLIDKIKADQIPVVYYPELSSHRVAEIIEEETGAKPLLLHACHNITRAEFDSGITYLDLMKQNVVNLKEGLDQ